MTTETAAEIYARARRITDSLGATPTTTPTTAADPARENFQALMEKAQADLADLRRPDGSARHTPTEMTERREQIRAGVTAALEAYQGPLIEAQSAVQAELAELTEFDPNSILADLSADELTRANGLRSFIQEDVANLSALALAPAIEAAIKSNDRPALALYFRELPKRSAAIGAPTATGKMRKPALAERSAWARLESAIKKHLTPPDDGKRKTLQKRYAELTKARSSAAVAADDGTPSIRV